MRTLSSWRRWACVPVLVLGASCARYEYDVIEPKLAPSHVGEKQDVVFDVAPLSYRFSTYQNRLLLRIYNVGDEKLELDGARSAVIDPTGQSRAIRSQALPGHAFVKLVLPPVRPEFVSGGGGGAPVYGPGAGRGEFGFSDYDEPRTYTLRDGGEVYWDWEGESTAGLVLAFKKGGKEITQEFRLARRRAE